MGFRSSQRRLQAGETILALLVRHAANVICRGRIGSAGWTEERRVGKKWTKNSVLFGETCFFTTQLATRQTHREVQRCECRRASTLVATEERSHCWMLTPHGLARGTAINKLPWEARNDHEFLSACQGSAWDVRPRRREAAAAVDDGVGVGADYLDEVTIEERGPEVMPRNR